jgi:hypothetical protein
VQQDEAGGAGGAEEGGDLAGVEFQEALSGCLWK